MFTKLYKASIATFALLIIGGALKAEDAMEAPVAEASAPVAVSGYVGVVSNYIWRGVDQNGRLPSIQGGLDLGLGAIEGLTLGVWTASIGGGTGHETDYYLSYEGAAGDLGYSVGWTMYSYDFTGFTSDSEGKNVAVQNEYAFGVSMAGAGFTYFMIPAEASTEGADDTGDKVALSWIELSYETELLGLGVSANYGTGTYNQQWVNFGGAMETTAILTVGLSKDVSDSVAVAFNKTKVMSQSDAGAPISGEYWMGLDVSF